MRCVLYAVRNTQYHILIQEVQMGSKNQTPQTSLDQCLETVKITNISNLVNSVFYFLQHVFITIADGDYHLLVIRDNQVLWYKNYKSIKGAKIAFSKRFGHMAYKPSIRKVWSPPYPPDGDWLIKKLPHGAGA